MTSINQKYILPFLFGLSCLAAVYIFFILNQQTNLLKSEFSRKGEFILENFSAASQVDILLKDEDRLNELINQIVQEDEDINIASIFIKDNSILLCNDSSFTFPNLNIKQYTSFDLPKYLLFVQPIEDQPENIIGLVGIVISKDRLNKIVYQTGLRLGLIGLLAFSFIGYFVNYLSKRLKTLAYNAIEEAKQIEEAYVKLQDLQIELEETNTSLERRVKERSSELKTANTDFEMVNGELKEFAYIVSHDLKAPLRAIDSLTAWIVEDYSKVLDDEGKDLIQTLKGRVTTMNQLIDGILQYSRVSRVHIEPESVDLNKVVKYIWDTENPADRFELVVKKELPTLFINYDKIQELFQKLIQNAIRFNDKEAALIEIDWTQDDTSFQFIIQDNGIGIEEKNYDEIFKIFKALNKKVYDNQVGLGLTIVKRIVEFYGGKISVDSEVGKRSAFIINFPKASVTKAASIEVVEQLEQS